MGTWIELRCEKSSEKCAEGDHLGRCWSHDNNGPMGMAEDNRASLHKKIREIEANGRSSGWKKTKEGWVCPFCVEASRLLEDEEEQTR